MGEDLQGEWREGEEVSVFVINSPIELHLESYSSRIPDWTKRGVHRHPINRWPQVTPASRGKGGETRNYPVASSNYLLFNTWWLFTFECDRGWWWRTSIIHFDRRYQRHQDRNKDKSPPPSDGEYFGGFMQHARSVQLSCSGHRTAFRGHIITILPRGLPQFSCAPNATR